MSPNVNNWNHRFFIAGLSGTILFGVIQFLIRIPEDCFPLLICVQAILLSFGILFALSVPLFLLGGVLVNRSKFFKEPNSHLAIITIGLDVLLLVGTIIGLFYKYSTDIIENELYFQILFLLLVIELILYILSVKMISRQNQRQELI